MIILFEGREYDFDFDAIDVRQLSVIKAHTGFGLAHWRLAISQGDPQALQALVWAMKQQNGEKVSANVGNPNFKPDELLQALADALLAEATDEDEPAPDPTKATARPSATSGSSA